MLRLPVLQEGLLEDVSPVANHTLNMAPLYGLSFLPVTLSLPPPARFPTKLPALKSSFQVLLWLGAIPN